MKLTRLVEAIKAAKKQLRKLEQNSAAQNPQGDLFDRKPEMPEPDQLTGSASQYV